MAIHATGSDHAGAEGVRRRWRGVAQYVVMVGLVLLCLRFGWVVYVKLATAGAGSQAVVQPQGAAAAPRRGRRQQKSAPVQAPPAPSTSNAAPAVKPGVDLRPQGDDLRDVVRHDLVADADAAGPTDPDRANATELPPPPQAADDSPPQTSAPPTALVLANPAENGLPVRFAVDGALLVLRPGEHHTLEGSDARIVRFHRGGGFGEARLVLEAGTYEFRVTDAGWDLLPRDDANQRHADVP